MKQLLLFAALPLLAQYDVVISGGHVMDPESGLNAVRHIGSATAASPQSGRPHSAERRR